MQLKDIYNKPLIPVNMSNEESKKIAAALNRYYEADLALAKLAIALRQINQ